METLRDLWKVLSWWSKCIKLFSHLSIYPGELLWDIFCTFLRIFVFFYVPVFFENHSVASYQFLTDAPGIFWRLTLLKESFQNISSSAGRHLKLFCRGSFRGTLLYSWRLFRFTLWNFVFYVTLTFPSKEFQSTYPSAGSIMQYFGAYFKYVNILPILCMNAMILLWSPSVLCIFGCFESIL